VDLNRASDMSQFSEELRYSVLTVCLWHACNHGRGSRGKPGGYKSPRI